ncbi:MAG: tetratricopeptide repeat protein [Phycisphaerales bacterium]|jgi:tetratricopeptide (TPR) repeat protein
MDAPSRLSKLMKMVDADPGDAFCLYAIAQEHARLGDSGEAIAWFDRTIATDPSHAYARFHKARVLEGLGRIPEAIECLREGLAAAEASRDGKAASELAGALASLAS